MEDVLSASALVTIFLDYDGVLHPTWAKTQNLFQKAAMLEAAAADLVNIELVISSSWAAYKDLDQLRPQFLPYPTLHRLIVDKTRQLQKPAKGFEDLPEREAQCKSWLFENGRHPERWLAIDDDANNFKSTTNLIRTDGNVGLTDREVRALREMVHAHQSGHLAPSDNC